MVGIDSQSEPKETSHAKHDNDEHEYESEFWLVDTMVPFGQLDTNIIVKWAGYSLS